jgi:hypothetical protein
MRDRSQQQSPSEVVAALSDLVLHPVQTFYHSWNWKAASLSAMLRAPLFLAATMRQGPEAVTIAVFAEAVYSAAISGIAPLEAMASGVPLVAANTGGITSYATEANAWLAEPTEAAFADAVRQVFQDHGARLAKVREGLATAFAHRWDCAALAYFPFMTQSTPNFGQGTRLRRFHPAPGLRPQPVMPMQ